MSTVQWAMSRIGRPSLSYSAKKGWIGIDVGTTSIKLSQLERHGSQYRIASRWSLRCSEQSNVVVDASGENGLPADELPTVLSGLSSFRHLFAGRRCASVISMSHVELRSFEIPASSPAEQAQMVAEELAADLGVEPDQLAFDCWDTSPASKVDGGMARMSAVSIPKQLAIQLVDRLLANGLACQVLDAMPCALARAVELAAPAAADDESSIAIDLGNTLPLVVLVRQGRPIFARTLRSVGMHAIMQPLRTNLQVSSEECEQLLTHYGVTATGQSASAVAHKTMAIIADPLQNLLSEIKRTVDYIGHQFRACNVRQIYLFGGGALVRNLPEQISQKLKMRAVPWTLGGDSSPATDPLYGVSAGLSALAWEPTSCT